MICARGVSSVSCHCPCGVRRQGGGRERRTSSFATLTPLRTAGGHLGLAVAWSSWAETHPKAVRVGGER